MTSITLARKRTFASLLGLTLIAGCAGTGDREAPPPPRLLGAPARTTDATWTAFGTAEYGARVVAARTPVYTEEERTAFGDAAAGAVADPFTAAFRLVLPLAPGVANAFAITATDAAGHVSLPVAVTIAHDLPYVDNLGLALVLPLVTADAGGLAATVIATGPEIDTPIEGLTIEIAVADYPIEIAPITVTLDARGRGGALVTGLTAAGVGTIVARATGARPDGEVAENRDGFAVLPGRTAALALAVEPEGAVPAGTDAVVTAAATDQHDNVVPRPALDLEVRGPGAPWLVGARVTGLRAAGEYRVVATDRETLVGAETTFTVVAGPPAALAVAFAPEAPVAGDTVAVLARALDAFGNAVAPEGLAGTWEIDGAPAAAPVAREDGWTVLREGPLTVAGETPVSARLRVDEATAFEGSAVLEVRAGPAATARVSVAPDPLPAGEVLVVTVSAQDAFGNDVAAAGAIIGTDAPEAVVLGDRIAGVTRASAAGAPYRVVAHVPGVAAPAEATFAVGPGALHHLELALSATALAAGQTLVANARAVDAWGNENASAGAPALGEDAPPPQGFTGLAARGGTVSASMIVQTVGAFTVTTNLARLAVVSARVTVTAGPPATVTVAPTPSPLVAGGVLNVGVQMSDAFGNAVTSPPPVVLATDAPGGIVVGRTIVGITRSTTAGQSYRVVADVPQAGVGGSATFTVAAGPLAALRLSLDADTVVAGDALTATAIAQDAFGNTVAGAGNPAIDGATVVSAAGGVTVGRLTPTAAGALVVTARLAALAPATGAVTVVAGPPGSLAFALDAPPAGGWAAGDVVGFGYTITDAFGNAAHGDLVVTTDAPGALAVGVGGGRGEIQGLTRAGTYSVRARVAGTALPVETENLAVGSDAAGGFDLVLTSGAVVAGGAVAMDARDGYGNAVDLAALVFTLDPSITRAGAVLTFGAAGLYAVTARLAANAAVQDTEHVSVTAATDGLPPAVTVVRTLPDPATVVVDPGGRVGARVDATDNTALASLEWRATFGDELCLATGGPIAVGAGTRAASFAIDLLLPACALPLSPVEIAVIVFDEAGNRRGALVPGTLAVAAPFTPPTGTGFVVGLAAWRGAIATPVAVAAGARPGVVLVADAGRRTLAAVHADRTQDLLTGATGDPVDLGGAPRDVAALADGRIFFTTFDADGPTSSVGLVRGDGTLASIHAETRDDVGAVAAQVTSQAATIVCTAWRTDDRVTCLRVAGDTVDRRFDLTSGITAPADLAIAGNDLWVLNGTAAVRRFTLAADGTGASGAVGFDASSFAPGVTALTASPASGRVILAQGSRVWSVPPANPATARILVSRFGAAVALAFDGGALLVADDGLNALFRIEADADPATDSTL